MKNLFSVNFLSDKEYFSISKGSRVIIFSDVNEYEEEILCLLENKVDYLELESIVCSWGGKVEMVLLDSLIKEFMKNKTDK